MRVNYVSRGGEPCFPAAIVDLPTDEAWDLVTHDFAAPVESFPPVEMAVRRDVVETRDVPTPAPAPRLKAVKK